jgi:hypothetical protein
MNNKTRILVIVSCGKSKAEELKKYPMRAEEAYRGPIFQVINKAKRENKWGENIELGVISAKYGFLRGKEYIKDYDLRMTPIIAKKLNSQVIEKINLWHKSNPFSLIYILMGKDYLITIKGLKERLSPTQVIIENMGGLGIGQKKLVQFVDSTNKKQN